MRIQVNLLRERSYKAMILHNPPRLVPKPPQRDIDRVLRLSDNFNPFSPVYTQCMICKEYKFKDEPDSNFKLADHFSLMQNIWKEIFPNQSTPDFPAVSHGVCPICFKDYMAGIDRDD